MSEAMQHHHVENPQLILSWKAPIRPYKKRGKNIIRFFLALAFLLSLLVIFFADTILLIPIWSVLFLFYVLTVTPPMEVEHKITKFGIESADTTMRWELLSHFYYTQRLGFTLLTIVSHPPFSMHAYFVVPNEDIKKKITATLSEHLIYQEKPNRTFTEKLIGWLSMLIPEDE